jgi:serpin B
MDLWTRLGKSDGGNLAISPAGISLALSMTWAGAKLHTAAEMQRVLHLNSDAASIATGWKAILETWTAPGRSLELHVANRLYGEQSYEFEQPFLDLTRTRFKAPLELVNLKSDSEAARQRINAWVGEVTRQRLQELVPTGALDRRARLVLVNAIYFLGTWAEPFLKESTRSADFHVSPGVNRRVPMMNRTGSYRFLHESGVSVIEVPYSDKDATLLVVLPDAPEGLRSLERSLSLAQLEGWLKQLRPSDVALSLPRFEAKSPVLSLPQLLSSLGMPLAFDRRRADFTGIGKPTALDERLTLGPLFHQAFVKVDENGTEAAAATAVVAVAAGAALAPVEFKADHPFLFLLLDKASGLILFLGRVADPT